MPDRRGSEGSLFSGDRIVRKNGIVKFEHIKFQSNALIDYVGKTVTVISTGSSWKIYHVTIYYYNQQIAIIHNQ